MSTKGYSMSLSGEREREQGCAMSLSGEREREQGCAMSLSGEREREQGCAMCCGVATPKNHCHPPPPHRPVESMSDQITYLKKTQHVKHNKSAPHQHPTDALHI